mgnify:CR=1 FL=1
MSNFWNNSRYLVLLLAAAFALAPFATAETLSKAELKKLISTASTPQDHERIANHFEAKADQLEAEAKEHEELAAEYSARPNPHGAKHPMSGRAANHCKFFAKKFREAAKEARALARDHQEMAETK